MNRRKQELWAEYYKAMRAGDPEQAQRIIRLIHQPTPTGRTAQGSKRGGCGRCGRRRFN